MEGEAAHTALCIVPSASVDAGERRALLSSQVLEEKSDGRAEKHLLKDEMRLGHQPALSVGFGASLPF